MHQSSLPLAEADQPVKNSAGPRRILIVDDQEHAILTLQAGLQKLSNCKVITATSGEQALQFFTRQPFDLLITDHNLPGISGLLLAAQIRQHYPQTIIIMITAYGNDRLYKQAADIPIQNVVDKPVKLKEIRRVVSEALNRKEDSVNCLNTNQVTD